MNARQMDSSGPWYLPEEFGGFCNRPVTFLDGKHASVDTLQESWRESVKGMEFAINFVKNNVGIDSPASFVAVHSRIPRVLRLQARLPD